MAEYKKENYKYLVAIGCLVKRYKAELQKAIPEVDLWISIDEYNDFWKNISTLVYKMWRKMNYLCLIEIELLLQERKWLI